MPEKLPDDYNDIIDLPHHRSVRHAPMERLKRAAQFAPFAALSGYEEVIAAAVRQHETNNEEN